MSRIDTILGELSSRHRNTDARFLAEVRPMVERILAPETPEEARLPLLELLAETFERDVKIRRDLAVARRGLIDFFNALRRQLGG